MSVRYHLVVPTAPAQTPVGQIPYSLLGSQAPKLYLAVSGRSLEERHCSCSSQARLPQHLRAAPFLLIVMFPQAAMNSSIESHLCFFSLIGCPSRGKLCPNHQSLLQQTGLNLCLSTLKDCLSRTCCCLELSSPFPGLRSQLGCRSARRIQLFKVTPVLLGKPQLWPPAS